MRVIDKSGRVFFHHEKWEDANNGLYNVGNCPVKRLTSKKLLGNSEDFWDAMCQMKIDWPCSFEHNLSDKTQNRRAWLGQAACNYNHNAEFNLTIEAWNELSDSERNTANATANKMIEMFEKESSYYAKTLFD